MDVQDYEKINETNEQLLHYMDYFSDLSVKILFILFILTILLIVHSLLVGNTLNKLTGEKKFSHRIPLLKGVAVSKLLDGENKFKLHMTIQYTLYVLSLFAPPLIVLILFHNILVNEKIIKKYSKRRWRKNLNTILNIITFGILGLLYLDINDAGSKASA